MRVHTPDDEEKIIGTFQWGKARDTTVDEWEEDIVVAEQHQHQQGDINVTEREVDIAAAEGDHILISSTCFRPESLGQSRNWRKRPLIGGTEKKRTCCASPDLELTSMSKEPG